MKNEAPDNKVAFLAADLLTYLEEIVPDENDKGKLGEEVLVTALTAYRTAMSQEKGGGN